jgi:hypothetical protein
MRATAKQCGQHYFDSYVESNVGRAFQSEKHKILIKIETSIGTISW